MIINTQLKALNPEGTSTAPNPAAALSVVRKAEDLGIKAAWSVSGWGGIGGDALPLFAAAAAQTERILLGTSIVQTWPRHPVAMAQEVRVIASLAPGRFRLGVGPGHKQAMERSLGVDFRAPLGHLKEYLRILKGLLQDGEIDFDGEYYTAHTTISAPVEVPVMASALRPRSFELCGAEADGAISWLCPPSYLRDVALPAMVAGAERAGRPVPPLIAHVPVCVHEDVTDVYAATRNQFDMYPRLPFYAAMFEAAGFPKADQTGWTNQMLDSVVVCGDETAVAKGLERVFDMGASEVIASVIRIQGKLAGAPGERTLKLLAQL